MMQTLSTAWNSVSVWTRGCLTLLLGSFLLLGLLYWGYCWGWWGRENLALQYLFQCQCPPASERVRYRPFTLLVSACRQPFLYDRSPNGRMLVFTERRSPQTIQLLDLETRQTHALDVRGTKPTLRFLTDHLLVARSFIGLERHYTLLDRSGTRRVALPSIKVWRDPLDPPTLARLQQMDQVIALPVTAVSYELVALGHDPFAHPEDNLVLVPSEYDDRERMLQQFDAAGIAYHQLPLPVTTGRVQGVPYAPSGRFWADHEGIALAATGERIVALGDTAFAPNRRGGWVLDERAVIYQRGTRHVIDLGLAFHFFPVTHPLLLLEVPEEYRE
jgi:hypothetical protein